jgi:transcriptional regulator with XRE-family HTH domain
MQTEINLKLGKKIRELRSKRKVTQEELAEMIKTSYKYVQRIESKNPPDIRVSTVDRIAVALKTSPIRLFDF